MEYVLLGRTGVKVSRLCFGAMSFGTTADEQESAALFRRCREAGINFFDCADVYGGGRSEEILGALARSERDDLVLTSKVAGATMNLPNAGGLSRRHIVRAVENSLRRLQTDRIDLYFAHRFDDQTAMEETLRAFDQLIREGKVLYWGVSNWAAWQVAKSLGLSALHGLAPAACIQPMYNLVMRQAEVELLPLAHSEGLGVITYSPLGGGLLSGKYTGGQKPQAGRLIDDQRYATRYGDPGQWETARRLQTYADQLGKHPATLAVAWVMGHPAVTAPIIGARSVEQLEASLAAATFAGPPEWRREVSRLSHAPPPATDRREEAPGD